MKVAICDDNRIILDGLAVGIRDLEPGNAFAVMKVICTVHKKNKESL